jgi:hypothetical protein
LTLKAAVTEEPKRATFAGRAEGEGEIAMRLHERIYAMRQRRRRLSFRERLRRYRRLVGLGLKAKAAK